MKKQLRTKIDIQLPLQLLVVENSLTGLDIKKGSHIYCGLCGHTIGRVNEDIELPASHEKLLSIMSGKKVSVVNSKNVGLYHTCGKFLFTDKPSWVFIGFDEWKRQTDEIVKNAFMKELKQKLESKKV